jgi:hypothetical protein
MSGLELKRRFGALPDILACIASIGIHSLAAAFAANTANALAAGFAVNTANAWQRK